jgi:hypothetical protein
MPYLSRASAHFTILELAHQGQLTEMTDDFVAYVYPRQLDKVLELECNRLVTRRDVLRTDLSARHPAAPELNIPAELALDESSASASHGPTEDAVSFGPATGKPSEGSATSRKKPR